jgi:hypothetical protein
VQKSWKTGDAPIGESNTATGNARQNVSRVARRERFPAGLRSGAPVVRPPAGGAVLD